MGTACHCWIGVIQGSVDPEKEELGGLPPAVLMTLPPLFTVCHSINTAVTCERAWPFMTLIPDPEFNPANAANRTRVVGTRNFSQTAPESPFVPLQQQAYPSFYTPQRWLRESTSFLTLGYNGPTDHHLHRAAPILDVPSASRHRSRRRG
jgi:hypothetical protein